MVALYWRIFVAVRRRRSEIDALRRRRGGVGNVRSAAAVIPVSERPSFMADGGGFSSARKAAENGSVVYARDSDENSAIRSALALRRDLSSSVVSAANNDDDDDDERDNDVLNYLAVDNLPTVNI